MRLEATSAPNSSSAGRAWYTIEPGRVPALEEIEFDVKSAWLDQKQREIKRIAFEAMRARYTVVVPPIELASRPSIPSSPPVLAVRGGRSRLLRDRLQDAGLQRPKTPNKAFEYPRGNGLFPIEDGFDGLERLLEPGTR